MFICPSCKVGYESGQAFCPEDGTRLVSQSQMAAHPIANDPLVGAVLGKSWKLIRPIGSGGMGVVYEAHHITLGRRRAVKVLREQVSRDADVVQRFQREAQSASRIGHENIIEIVDFGTTPGGASYMVMELLEGRDLADHLLQTGPMDLDRALPILLQCCRALGAAHAKGIVHRDIKPENVFLVDREGEDDFVKIVDFGIAKISDLETPGAPGRKLTKTGMIFGTPEYMSTEQAYGRPTDARSDIYGLGVIAYEMFTGHVPFEGQTFMAVISQHMLDLPRPMREMNPRVKIPADIEAIVMRTLEKDPNDRFQTMSELHDAFLGFMHREGLGGAVPSRLADVSFSAPLPRAPLDESPAVDSTPTPERQDSTGRILMLADEPDRPPRLASGVPWGMLIGIAIVGLGVVGALALLRPELFGVAEEETPDAGGIVAVEPVHDTLDLADGAADTGDSAAAAGEPSTVEVRVVTRPRGASIRVDGAPGCPSSPCTVALIPGERVTITAERDGRTAERSVTASPDGGEVELALPRGGRPNQGGMTMMGGETRPIDQLPTEDHPPDPNDLRMK